MFWMLKRTVSLRPVAWSGCFWLFVSDTWKITLEDDISIIFLPSNLNICFGCSKEPFHWDCSFEYPQHRFWLRNKKISFNLPTFIWKPDDSSQTSMAILNTVWHQCVNILCLFMVRLLLVICVRHVRHLTNHLRRWCINLFWTRIQAWHSRFCINLIIAPISYNFYHRRIYMSVTRHQCNGWWDSVYLCYSNCRRRLRTQVRHQWPFWTPCGINVSTFCVSSWSDCFWLFVSDTWQITLEDDVSTCPELAYKLDTAVFESTWSVLPLVTTSTVGEFTWVSLGISVMVGEIVSVSVTAIVGEGWGLPGVDDMEYSMARFWTCSRCRSLSAVFVSDASILFCSSSS